MSSVKINLNQSLRTKVEAVLKLDLISRNSDRNLIAAIWKNECCDKGVWNVLDGLMDGRLSNPESIRRLRQMLQREFPELQGTNDKNRMKDADHIRHYVNN